MKKVLLCLICVLFAAFVLPNTPYVQVAKAADCATKACINVYTENGQIVIEGKKGKSRTKASATSQAKVKHVTPQRAKPKPSVSKIVTPRPIKPRIASPTPKSVLPPKIILPKKAKKVVRTLSLSDRLVKMLPTSKIGHQPESSALIHVPVIYWCDLPSQFVTRVSIIGEVIDVAMRPSFLWSFGDGTFFATTSSGAPYPKGGISHTYRAPGRYLVVLVATWGGLWTFDGVSRAITGEIHQTSMAFVLVKSAPTVITR